MKLYVAIAALMVSAGIACAAEQTSPWQTDYNKALQQAKTEKKVVLLDFTGSDWCGWCKKLNAEVFSTKPFTDFAAKNLVLVEVDFPHGKQQTEAVKQQNAELKKKYPIHGFPTVFVLDSNGNLLDKMGYMPGGPDAWLGRLKEIMAQAKIASPAPAAPHAKKLK